MDLPLLGLLEHQHRLRPEEMRIEQGDRSKRLDEEVLERYWTMDSQKCPPQIPIWAKEDKIVQGIGFSKPSCSTISPSPDPHQFSSSASAELEGNETPVNIGTRAPSSLTTAPDLGREGQRKPKPKRHGGRTIIMSRHQRTEPAKKRVTKSVRASRRRSTMITRIQNRASEPALATRSHRLSQFYEIDHAGIVRRCPR